MEPEEMSVNQAQEPKRRGRPPGTKNKVKKTVAHKVLDRPKKIATSMEATIRQLLTLPATAETKIRLIEAALDI